MLRTLFLSLTLAASLSAVAQVPGQGAQSSAATEPAPARSMEDLVPSQGGIRSQNIFEVKPEVKPDASSGPDYMKQNNGQRNQVQPGNNAPMYRDVKSGIEGFTSLPKSEWPEAGVLIQPQVQYPGSRMTTAGQAWREVRNNWVIPYGGALFLISVGALLIYYLWHGPIGRADPQAGGGRIERFTPFERSAHWTNAIAFCILAISGLTMAFGKFFLLPVLGGTLYGGLTYLLKNLHNFAGPIFTVSLVVVFFTFIRDEWPQRGDWHWLAKAGGAFDRSGEEPPSYRFNAGEKLIFWAGVFLLGIVVVSSGLVMDKLIPNLDYGRQTMQMAQMVHSTAAVLMMCLFALHIFLGTIGMRGAYTVMRRGYTSEAWAEEHHRYWYEDVKAGKIPAQRSQPLVIRDEAEKARPA
jgi:formate dehydrogenase subunit gamma